MTTTQTEATTQTTADPPVVSAPATTPPAQAPIFVFVHEDERWHLIGDGKSCPCGRLIANHKQGEANDLTVTSPMCQSAHDARWPSVRGSVEEVKPAEEARPAAPPSTAAAAAREREPVPFEPRDTSEMYRYAQFLARSELIPRSLQGKPSDVLLVLLKGRELGLTPMQSIGDLHVIDGKVELSALLMVSLILKSGLCEYWELVHSDMHHATYVTKRKGARREVEFTYSIEEAEQMGLLDKGRSDYAKANNQWKRQPRTMLRRRAQANLAREVYPEICKGLYDQDELQEQRDLLDARERYIASGSVDAVEARRELAAPSAEPSAFQQAAAPETVSVAEIVKPTPTTEPVKRDPLKSRLKDRAAKSTQATLPVDAPPDYDPEVDGYLCAVCGVPGMKARGDKCPACTNS